MPAFRSRASSCQEAKNISYFILLNKLNSFFFFNASFMQIIPWSARL